MHFPGLPPPWGRQEGGGAEAQSGAGAGKGPPPCWQALAPSYLSPKEPPGLDLVCEEQGPLLGFTCGSCWPSSQDKAQLCLLDKEESGFLCTCCGSGPGQRLAARFSHGGCPAAAVSCTWWSLGICCWEKLWPQGGDGLLGPLTPQARLGWGTFPVASCLTAPRGEEPVQLQVPS